MGDSLSIRLGVKTAGLVADIAVAKAVWKDFGKEVRATSTEIARGDTSEETRAKLVEQSAALEVATQKLKFYERELQSVRAEEARMARGSEVVAKGHSSAAVAGRVLSQQLSQVAQQAMAGTNVLQALAIQLPDIAVGMGAAGGAAGKFGQVLGGPLGIGVAVVASALIPFIGNLIGGATAADDAARAHETLADKLDLGKHSYDEVIAASRDLSAERRKERETTLQAARDAEDEAQKNLKNALSLRLVLQARLENARIVERQSQHGLGDPGATAARGAASAMRGAYDNALSANTADIAALKAALNDTTTTLATELARLQTDPIARIKEHFTQLRNEASATTHDLGKLTAKFAELNREEQRQIDAEQRRNERGGNPPAETTDFIMPASGPITGRFGETRPGHKHGGLDIAVPVGTGVQAGAGGVVTFAGKSGDYGNMVEIDHGGGTKSRLAHLSEISVAVGDAIQQGQKIGLSGGAKGAEGSGNSRGPHLHYEVLVNGKKVDPGKGTFATDEIGTAMRAGRDTAEDQKRRAEEAARQQQQIASGNAQTGLALNRIGIGDRRAQAQDDFARAMDNAQAIRDPDESQQAAMAAIEARKAAAVQLAREEAHAEIHAQEQKKQAYATDVVAVQAAANQEAVIRANLTAQLNEIERQHTADVEREQERRAQAAKRAAQQELNDKLRTVRTIENYEDQLVAGIIQGRQSLGQIVRSMAIQMAQAQITAALHRFTEERMLTERERQEQSGLSSGGLIYHLLGESKKTAATVAGTQARSAATAAGAAETAGIEAASAAPAVAAEAAKTAAVVTGEGVRTAATGAAAAQNAAITSLTNKKEIVSHAATAASKAYSAMADIPVVGPILGAAAAAATFTAVMAYSSLASFDKGTNVLPNDMVAQIHAGERIVPAADNREMMAIMRQGAGLGGGAKQPNVRGGDTRYYYSPTIHAPRGSTLESMIRKERGAFISAIRAAVRSGALSPA